MARINIVTVECRDCGNVFVSAMFRPECSECKGFDTKIFVVSEGAKAAADFEGPASDDSSFYRPSPFRRIVLTAAARELDRRASGGR